MIDLRHATGHGVRVALLDSGVHPHHPHVGWAMPGFSVSLVNGQPRCTGDSLDVNGHGTACAGIVRWGARDAAIIPVRVLDEKLEGHSAAIAEALRRLRPMAPPVVSFSLGVREGSDALDAAWGALSEAGVVGVAAVHAMGTATWPVGRPSVISVGGDASLAEWAFRVDRSASVPDVVASPYPRPIPGRPRTENLSGTSFAAPRVAALVARVVEVRGATARDQLLEILDANAARFGRGR